MIYKEIYIRSLLPDAASTELMYEIAGCRADGIELVRFNISYGTDDHAVGDTKKTFSSLIRTLKLMKQKGSIQFFATGNSFLTGSTEAIFLFNKYSDLLSSMPKAGEGEEFIYVKI